MPTFPTATPVNYKQGDKVEGMKYLLAQVARGRDVSEFYADVVRNVIVSNCALDSSTASVKTQYLLYVIFMFR